MKGLLTFDEFNKRMSHAGGLQIRPNIVGYYLDCQ